MVPAVDAELSPRRARAVERHVTGCPSCRAELAATRALLEGVRALPGEAAVTAALEQATFRAVRRAAAAEDEARAGAWWRMPALSMVAAAASLAALAVGLGRRMDDPSPPAPTPLEVARPADQRPADHRPAPSGVAPARSPERTEVARRPVVSPEVPAEPPPELAARPDLFVELPILRHMEKLEHLDAIQATALGDGAAPRGRQGERSSG
jgi:anti-sigma factor RsiW